MQVPAYQLQVGLNDLPAARQDLAVSDGDFLGATQAALAEQGGAALQRVDHGLAELYSQQLQEANALRVADARNQTQTALNEWLYGKDGALFRQGAAAFQAEADGRSASDTLLQQFDQHINDVSADLGNEAQRNEYQSWAATARQQTAALLAQHEGQQYRQYQRGVGLATIAGQQQTMALNYNNPDLLAAGVTAIGRAGVDLARLEGYPDEYGQAEAGKQVSAALHGAVRLAVQQGDASAASQILQQFGGQMQADALLDGRRQLQELTDSSQAQQIAGQVMTTLADRFAPDDWQRLRNITQAAAWAALQAGPTAVRQAQTTAGADWLAQMPAVVRQSVTRNLQAYQDGAGQSQPPTLAEAEGLALAQLGKAAGPDLRRQVLAEVGLQFHSRRQALRQQQEQSRGAAFGQLLDNGGRFSALPAALRAGLSAKDADRLLAFAKNVAGGQPAATDWRLYYRLQNDDKLLMNTHLPAWRDRLPGTEYQQLQDRQRLLQQGSETPGFSPEREVLQRYLREAGINPQPHLADSGAVQTLGRIQAAYEQRMAAARQQSGKPLAAADLERIAGQLFSSVAVQGKLFGQTEKPAVLVDSHQDKVVVPARDRAQIIEALRSVSPGRAVTEDQVFYYYLLGKGLVE